MRYLLYTLEYPPQIGGVADYYYNLVKNWPSDSSISVYDISEKGRRTKFNFFYWPGFIIRLIRKIKNEKLDYILIGQILPLGLIAYLASFFNKFSYSVFFHGLDYSSSLLRKDKKIFTYLILIRAKKIICANSYVAKTIKKDFPKLEKKIIISNPGAKVERVDLEILKNLKEKYNLEKKKIIFSLGRLIERKGFDNMIKALNLLKKENINLFNNTLYLIAGSGPYLNTLKKLRDDFKLKKNIIFLGRISEQEKFALYSLANFFAMPARLVDHDYEGFGIVYIEANLFKKPVLAANSGGVSDAVINNLNGFLIDDANNIALIKKSIEILLKNDELAKNLGDMAYMRAKKYFNWQILAKNLSEKL